MKYSPENIIDKLEACAERLEEANRILAKNQQAFTVAREKAKVIIMAADMSRITNPQVREHRQAIRCDPKNSTVTVPVLDAMVYMETEEISKVYISAEKEVERVKQEIEIWKVLLMDHQSQRKLKGIELEVLRG